jgi:hypothetical protein
VKFNDFNERPNSRTQRLTQLRREIVQAEITKRFTTRSNFPTIANGHIAARVVSDAGTTPTTRTWQQPRGHPEGLTCASTSSSERDPNQYRTSSASGRVQVQQGNCMRLIDMISSRDGAGWEDQ